ncbi:MAG TPA: type II secretion system protein [Nitrospirota bacterium]
MKSRAFRIHRKKCFSIRNPRPAFRYSPGFTYLALLAAIVIIGISLGAAGKYWSNVILRDKEEELLFRGDQYRQAIERYYLAIPGKPEYPQNLEDLLNDSRTPAGKRHLRQLYKDPVSGDDFVVVRHALTQRIIGVHSPSDKQPLKQAGFPVPYNTSPLVHTGFPVDYNFFEGKKQYREWVFASTIQEPAVQGLITPPGRPFVPPVTPVVPPAQHP